MPTSLLPQNPICVFKPRDTISLYPDSLWLVKKGIVKTVTCTEEGTAVILGYWRDNEVVGQPLSQIKPYQIQCVTSVVATRLPLHQCDSLIETLCHCVQQTERLLYLVRTERLRERLLNILTWLSSKFGCRVEQGRLIELRLTHQDLAELVGATRPTITRLLNQFEHQGIISRPQNKAIIVHEEIK